MSVDRLTVIGTGLMGASVGLAAKRAGVGHVAGFDTDRDALAGALGRGAVDQTHETLGAAVEGADLVVVATTVRSITDVVASAAALAGSQATITDVGSTKERICSELADVREFVGGHPLCGSETSGPDSARADLFDGATWFLTPVAQTAPDGRAVVMGFVTALGARPVEVDPATHDRLVALVSHLPHALANLLITQVGAGAIDGLDPIDLAARSFRDMTRVAGTNPGVWTDIFLDNRENLVSALAELRGRIQELEAMLRAGDASALLHSIEEAAGRHDRAARERGDG